MCVDLLIVKSRDRNWEVQAGSPDKPDQNLGATGPLLISVPEKYGEVVLKNLAYY